jgi:acetyl-CoA carboxylase biotin carboxyl carrier protein
MNTREIRSLLKLIDEFDVAEFELERDGVRLRILRGAVDSPPEPAAPAVQEAPPVETAPAEPVPAPENLHVFTAPMVGTYYSSPKPDADSFVQVGSTIREGDTLCIIEAMKIFNQIESDVDGQIVRILVESGQPVEYGEPLFEMRT